MKLIEEKQELIKENKDLRLNNKQNIFSSKASVKQIEQLNNALNETQIELSKCKGQYNMLLEKYEGMQKEQKEKTKQGFSEEKIRKNYEVF